MGQVTLERDVFIWGLGSLPAYAKSACVPVCLYNGRKIARNIHSFTLYLPLSGMYRMRYFARTDMHGHGPHRPQYMTPISSVYDANDFEPFRSLFGGI